MKRINQTSLSQFTTQQLLSELQKRKTQQLIAVFNQDKLTNGTIKLNQQFLKKFKVGEITSLKLDQNILCLITEKDTLLAQLIKEYAK